MTCKDVIAEINQAKTIVIIQAENPDGDSLASALALENILSQLGKDVKMFCPVIMPKYLRFLEGWDRVEEDLPSKFDLSIIVDTSSALLLERVFTDRNLPILRSKPTVVIDHHTNEIDLPYQTVNLTSETAAATGELIYEMANVAGWQVDKQSAKLITHSILFDTLGMSTEGTTAATLRTVAELVEKGVNLAELEDARRSFSKKSVDLIKYKARLLDRIDYKLDGQLAEIVIPWEEIEEYSDRYNPPMLVMDEMRMTEDVKLAIAYKTYPDGKITGKIRANFGYDIADKLAEEFGGGGHPYAAGFKLRDQSLESVQGKVEEVTGRLLSESS